MFVKPHLHVDGDGGVNLQKMFLLGIEWKIQIFI